MFENKHNVLSKEDFEFAMKEYREYLEFAKNNLNVSQASKAMFIHRNTMIYKLNKLKANSQFDLTNFNDAYILYSLLENK